MGMRPQNFRESARRGSLHEDASHVSAGSCLSSPEEDESAIPNTTRKGRSVNPELRVPLLRKQCMQPQRSVTAIVPSLAHSNSQLAHSNSQKVQRFRHD